MLQSYSGQHGAYLRGRMTAKGCCEVCCEVVCMRARLMAQTWSCLQSYTAVGVVSKIGLHCAMSQNCHGHLHDVLCCVGLSTAALYSVKDGRMRGGKSRGGCNRKPSGCHGMGLRCLSCCSIPQPWQRWKSFYACPVTERRQEKGDIAAP